MVIINCSPKSKGVSKEITDELINKYNKSKFIYLKDWKIKHCLDCGYCEKIKGCCLQDDMQELYKLFNEEDIFIIVSPCHFDNPTPLFITMLSRQNAIYKSKYILKDSMIDKTKKRKVISVLVGGSKDYGQFASMSKPIHFFSRTINAEYIDPIIISNTDNIKPNMDNILKQINDKIRSI